MFNGTCPKCGSTFSLPGGHSRGFCGTCGNPVEINHTLSDSPKAKRKNEKPMVITLVVVLFIMICVSIAAFALTRSSYQNAEIEFFKSVFQQKSSGETSNYRINFSADYGSSDDTKYLGDILFEGTLERFEKNALAKLTLTSKGDSMNVVGAYNGTKATLIFPEVLDYFLSFPVTKYYDTFDSNQIDKKKLEDSINNILTEYFTLIKDNIEVEKGVELSGGDVTLKCDRYTIVFTYEMVNELIHFAIDEIRDNENLMDFISQYMNSLEIYIGSDYTMDDFLDDLEEHLDDNDGMIDVDERLFRMTVMVKGKKIVSREIDKMYQMSGTEMSYQFLANKKNAYAEILVDDLNGGTISFKGSFKKLDGAWNGTVTVKAGNKYDDTDFRSTMKISEMKVSNKQLSGKIKFSVDTMFYGDMADMNLNLDFISSGETQTVDISGSFKDSYGEYDLGELTLNYSLDKIDLLDLPVYDEEFGIVYRDHSEENRKRMDEMDLYIQSNRDEFDKWQEVFNRNPIFEDLILITFNTWGVN